MCSFFKYSFFSAFVCKDRHATAYTPPKVDTSQDWLLLKGEENDYGTILEFVRELDTCDQEDMVINVSLKML